MGCRTTPAVDFKTKLGFDEYDPIITQEQSILSKIKTIFSAEKILLQHNVLGYRIDEYFPEYKLAIEIDELGHSTRDIGCEIERQKALEKKLNCELIRINPAKEKIDVFVEIDRTQNYIIKSIKRMTKKSTKKSVVDEISNKLLRLEFKPNNSIKTKCLKYELRQDKNLLK